MPPWRNLIDLHDLCELFCRQLRSDTQTECHNNMDLQRHLETVAVPSCQSKFSPSVWPHNLATGFRPPSATVVSAEPFLHGACRRKWRLADTDLCHCGETQTMFHIVESCPLTKLMAAYIGYILWMKTLFRGWPVMVHDTHTRRRRMQTTTVWYQKSEKQKPDTPPLLSLNSSQAFPTFPPRPLIIPLIQGWTPGTQLKEQELS